MRKPAVIALLLLFATTLFAQKRVKPSLYVPMDYSTCGYHASESVISDLAVAIYIPWQEGDCSGIIQQAIDQLSKLKADKQGFRGAILLGEGVFRLDHSLHIPCSGIVLRGTDRRRTVLEKHGYDRGALIYLEGQATTVNTGDTLWLAADTVKAGSTRLPLTVRQPRSLHAGDRIHIVRKSTREWIARLKMNDFGGGLDYTGWKPTDIDITWDRTVTAIDGSHLTIDAPITTTLTQPEAPTYILLHRPEGEVSECGIENMTLQSAVNGWNAKDEDHCWDGIFIDHARDVWVRRVIFRHLAGSAVNLQQSTSRITVEDCIATDPVSEIGGWRRQVFLTRGQQTLFQRCISRQGIHDFAAGYCAAGPNAFVQCEGETSLGFSGSIGSWAAGLLFDIVNIDGHDLHFGNLEQFQFGTGWNTANSMFWQCTASTISCYSPDADNRCSGHGCWGTLTGDGNWTSSNDHVSPRSLFYDQLSKRLSAIGKDAALAEQLGQLLPRPTNATSSPTVEQAMQLAEESLTQPRLTMEAWIDSLSFTASVAPTTPFKVRTPQRSSAVTPTIPAIGITQGHLTLNGRLATGNAYDIPWWSGRVKDNFIRQGARPAITRFVPGREGTGWTDRIDSVVGYLHQSHYSHLDHHYGLWYDLRRTDHERVRRADGDVWPPFYEQPFSRSGQGTAWDGLSCYDLTRPNNWYWGRLQSFARQSSTYGILLFHEHYFQHNILEAGAHWVDCPWRPVNNINGTNFPEPVPFAGDKRIFMAEQFYNEEDPVLRPLHRQYIRMCLEQMKDHPNVVHLLSAEYTGPLHFTRFWLQTIAEWEAETGHHPLVALSCTKDAQDSILSDPTLREVVDIIDIRYWHYNTEGLWAPEAGRNMAPRQWMRKMKVGKTGFAEAYRAVEEYRRQYPDKAVTFFSQQYPDYGWAILLAGGSLPNIPIRPDTTDPDQQALLHDICLMRSLPISDGVAMGSEEYGYLVYPQRGTMEFTVSDGRYHIYAIDAKTGAISLLEKNVSIRSTYRMTPTSSKCLYWLRKR
jgi:hypothetical protein